MLGIRKPSKFQREYLMFCFMAYEAAENQYQAEANDPNLKLLRFAKQRRFIGQQAD